MDMLPLAFGRVYLVEDLFYFRNEDNPVVIQGNIERNSRNPLLMPEILSHVFRFINDIKVIQACRLVHPTWHAEITPLFRKVGTVTLKTVEQVADYCNVQRAVVINPLPYGNTSFAFDLYLAEMKEGDAEVLNRFFTKHGTRISHLKLTLDERRASPLHWWTILYNCPNIEELTIVIRAGYVTTPFNPGDGGFTLFQNVQEDFRMAQAQLGQARNQIFPQVVDREEVQDGPIAPRLLLKYIEYVHVEVEGGCGDVHMGTAMDFLKTIFRECASILISVSCSRAQTNPPALFLGNLLYTCLFDSSENVYPKLRSLNFLFKPSHEQLDHLLKCERLERLTLVLGSDVRSDTLLKVLPRAACRLKHLEVYIQNPEVVRETIILPPRPTKALKSLKIFGHNDQSCLQFVRNSPKAEMLEVHGISLKYILGHLSESRENSPLKWLNIFQSNGALSIPEVSFGLITDCFNEVGTLELKNVTNRTLDLIYQTMPNLRDLKIKGTFTDEGISGIPQETCDGIHEMATHFFTEPAKLRQFVYISALSKLRRLLICSNNMTDISIMFGITALQNLEDLVVSGDLITERIAESIKKSMRLFTLDVCGCKNLANQPLTDASLQPWWDGLKRNQLTRIS